MYKNAGIKTIREAITRLMDGEVFYSSAEVKIYFDGSERDASPFRFGWHGLEHYFHKFSEWQTKTDWRDNVSAENPVLCWVWNDSNPKKIVAVEEFDINDKSYYANRRWYTNATPLTKEEALKYIIEE